MPAVEAAPNVERLRFSDDLDAAELAALPNDELRKTASEVARILDAEAAER